MDEKNTADSITRIAKGTKVKAHINTNSDIHIAGTLEGDVETSDRLVISESGKITGTVTAKEASIAGKFTGELRVLNHINISESAFVDGFIFSKTISVNEQATLIGILNVGDDVDVMNAKLKKAEKRALQAEKKPKSGKGEKSPDKVASTEQKQLEIQKPESPKPPQHRYLKKVLIGIPGSVEQDKAEGIRTACEHFMNALGFNLEIFDEPSLNPFYQNLSYTRKSPEEAEDIQNRFEKAKETIESALLKKGNADEESELQKAAKEIVTVIRELEEFVLVLGEVVLIQLMENDVQTLAAEILSQELKEKFSKSPEMVSSPEKVYAIISD